jgi:transcriptional antiterminator RfaH
MISENQNVRWFLAQLKPNCTKIANMNLKRQGFQTFLPLEEKTHQRKGKFVNFKKPLFPGYIFVAFDMAKSQWHTINSTYGITRLVSFGKVPTPLPKGLVAQLKLRYDADGKLLLSKTFKAGDQVMFIKGPFVNFIAEIESISPEQRAWVLLEIMGNKTRIAVEINQVQTINV